jgi:hypothetical protein
VGPGFGPAGVNPGLAEPVAEDVRHLFGHQRRVGVDELGGHAAVGVGLLMPAMAAISSMPTPAPWTWIASTPAVTSDECRHSVMFSRFIEKIGCPAYGPGRTAHALGRAAVGLDPAEAHRAALASPARRETLRWASSRLVRFFSELDLIGGPSMLLWRRSGLIA